MPLMSVCKRLTCCGDPPAPARPHLGLREGLGKQAQQHVGGRPLWQALHRQQVCGGEESMGKGAHVCDNAKHTGPPTSIRPPSQQPTTLAHSRQAVCASPVSSPSTTARVSCAVSLLAARAPGRRSNTPSQKADAHWPAALQQARTASGGASSGGSDTLNCEEWVWGAFACMVELQAQAHGDSQEECRCDPDCSLHHQPHHTNVRLPCHWV